MDLLTKEVQNFSHDKSGGLIDIIKPILADTGLTEMVIDYFCSELALGEAIKLKEHVDTLKSEPESVEHTNALRNIVLTVLSRAEEKRGTLPISDDARAMLKGKTEI